MSIVKFSSSLKLGRLNELYFENVIYESKGIRPRLTAFELQKKGIDYVVNGKNIEVKSHKSKYQHFIFETLSDSGRLGWLFTSKADFIAFTDHQNKRITFLDFKNSRAQIVRNLHRYKEQTNEPTLYNLDKSKDGLIYQSRFIKVQLQELQDFITINQK